MKKVLYTILVTVLFMACRPSNSYKIVGTIYENEVEDTVYLCLLSDSEDSSTIINQAIVKKDGTFEMNGSMDSIAPNFYFLRFKDGTSLGMPFYLESGDIDFVFNDEKIAITGTKYNNLLQEQMDSFTVYYNNLIALQEQISSDTAHLQFSVDSVKFNKYIL